MRRLAVVGATVLVLAVTGFAFPAGAEAPARLESVDPLKLPPPAELEPLRFAAELREPADKIHPRLWAEAVKRGPETSIPVIVTLREPILPLHLRDASVEADAHRVQWVASMAHRFASQAGPRGLTDLRALSHVPVVFGRIQGSRLGELAEISEVHWVREDEVRHSSRVQGGALMSAPALRAIGGRGAGVEVAILDSGIYRFHAELASRVSAAGNFTPGPGDSSTDQSGHGTSVAGIVAGTSNGMAPDAKLWALQVLHGNPGSGSDSMILAGLNAAYANRNSFGVLDIVNMSLGGGGPYNSDCDASIPDYASIINQLVAAGIPVFVASGNDGFLNGVSEPACLSNAISVGAVYDASVGTHAFSDCTDLNPVANQITCYSNSGNPLDILAPSHDSNTTAADGGYESSFGGTSAASPYAAGVAAQIFSLRPATTPAQIRTAFMTTGLPLLDVNGINRRRIDGMQAYAALSGGTGPCVPGPETLCIDNNSGDRRFRVQVFYNSVLGGGVSGYGKAVPLVSLGADKGGMFWFFSASNPEMLVKVLNGCGSNGYFWVFSSAGTTLGMTTTITDTIGASPPFVFSNPDQTPAAPVGSISAFACP